MNKHLKLRRHTATVVCSNANCSNANPQDFDNVECGAADEGSLSSSDYYNDDNKSQDKKDILSPFSRRLGTVRNALLPLFIAGAMYSFGMFNSRGCTDISFLNGIGSSATFNLGRIPRRMGNV